MNLARGAITTASMQRHLLIARAPSIGARWGAASSRARWGALLGARGGRTPSRRPGPSASRARRRSCSAQIRWLS